MNKLEHRPNTHSDCACHRGQEYRDEEQELPRGIIPPILGMILMGLLVASFIGWILGFDVFRLLVGAGIVILALLLFGFAIGIKEGLEELRETDEWEWEDDE